MAILADRGTRDIPTKREYLPSMGFSPPFVLMHAPRGWAWNRLDKRWLPFLQPLLLIPGANGVRGAAEQPDWTITQAAYERRGVRFLPLDTQVLLSRGDKIVEDVGYRQFWEASDGRHYRDVWSIPIQVGQGTETTIEWERDDDGYHAWLGWLLDSGTLPGPQASVITSKIKRQKARLDRLAGQAHDGAPPLLRHNYAAAEAMYKEMIAGQKKRPRKRYNRGKKERTDGAG